jgi:hypothetical protein
MGLRQLPFAELPRNSYLLAWMDTWPCRKLGIVGNMENSCGLRFWGVQIDRAMPSFFDPSAGLFSTVAVLLRY